MKFTKQHISVIVALLVLVVFITSTPIRKIKKKTNEIHTKEN